MAQHMREWLGPLIEHELKEVVEWKQRASRRNPDNNASTKDKLIKIKPVRDFSSKDFSSLFKDDGSSLSIRCNSDRTKAQVVQILSVR
jgi:hypothetical protein